MANKIVVANAVGVDRKGRYIIHSPSRWTTSVAQNPFFWYPWELAYLSSLLKRETDCDVTFVDGCLEKLNVQQYIEKVAPLKPNYLVMESSTRTIEDDKLFACEIKKLTGAKLIFCGPHPTAFPEETLEWADHVCQGEYELTVLDSFKGKTSMRFWGFIPINADQSLKISTFYPGLKMTMCSVLHTVNPVCRERTIWKCRCMPAEAVLFNVISVCVETCIMTGRTGVLGTSRMSWPRSAI